jgi:hypothetical protein
MHELENGKVTVSELKPSTQYIFTFQSLSVGSSGNKTSTKLLEVITSRGKLSNGAIAALSIVGLICFILIVIGIYTICR